jgi:hypothetical protein
VDVKTGFARGPPARAFVGLAFLFAVELRFVVLFPAGLVGPGRARRRRIRTRLRSRGIARFRAVAGGGSIAAKPVGFAPQPGLGHL